MDDSPCTLCTFWDKRCTHTWRITFHIEPLGGQIDFSTTPGMVPEHLKQQLTDYLSRFMEKMGLALQVLPIWDEVRAWQLANPERERCPGRTVRRDVPHLHVVRAEDLELRLGDRTIPFGGE